jgi:hypothetical protein
VTSSTCSNADDSVTVQTKGIVEFPSPKVTVNGFWGLVGFSFGLVMILAILYPLANVISALVKEKEMKLREGMMMMAVRGDALWFSWIFHFFCLFLPLSVALTVVGQGMLFQYSEGFFIWIYFFVFFMASVSYCILISTIFDRSLTASVIGNLVYFAGFFIYIGMSQSNVNRGQILLACLHPSAAFVFGTLGTSMRHQLPILCI